MVVTAGTVREYHDDDGWGVIDGRDVPGGCWVHFSAIAGDGYRSLAPGQAVSFRAAPVTDQDGYRFAALKVWPAGTGEPADPADDPSGAYASGLTVSYDD